MTFLFGAEEKKREKTMLSLSIWLVYSADGDKNKLRCTSGELYSNKAFRFLVSYLPLRLFFLICVVCQDPQKIKTFYTKVVLPLVSRKCFRRILLEEKVFLFLNRDLLWTLNCFHLLKVIVLF